MEILMNEEWDMLFLSYNSPKYTIIDENKIKLIESKTASGYIITEHYYDKLIDLYEKSFKHLKTKQDRKIYMNDNCWRNLMLTDIWYGIIDRIGKQRESYSDIKKKIVNYNV